MAAEDGGGAAEAPKQRCGPKPKELNPWMELSAGISEHPRMRELNGHLELHANAPAQASSTRDTLRGGGSEIVDKRMKELVTEMAGSRAALARSNASDSNQPLTPASLLSQVRACSWSPVASPTGTFSLTQTEETPANSPSGGAASSSVETAQQKLEAGRSPRNIRDLRDTFKTRKTYETKTDKTLKRLFVDMELARDARQSEYGHRTRVEHLDKVYNWYDKSIFPVKEDAKDVRKVPAFVVFKKDDPVSPGSMRVQRVTRPSPLLKAFEMGQSSSSPALLAEGTPTNES